MNFLNRARNQTAPPEGTVKEQNRQTQSSHRMSRTELFQEPSTRRGKAAMPARWEVEREGPSGLPLGEAETRRDGGLSPQTRAGPSQFLPGQRSEESRRSPF